MNKRIIILCILLISAHLSAQDISIELSMDRKSNLDFPLQDIEDSNLHPAYLTITYRNLSNHSYYFLKASNNKSGLPELPFLIFPNGNVKSDSLGKIPRYNDYSDYNFKTKIGSSSTFSSGWFIEDIDLKEGTSGFISTNIADIYHSIRTQYFPEKSYKEDIQGALQLFHNPSDITQDTIMNNSADEFIYLKAGEKYTDTYNLIGFQLVGGNFTFELYHKSSLDHVCIGSSWNENEKRWIEILKQLPVKVGEYELYIGNFLTNTVCIQFPGIKPNQ